MQRKFEERLMVQSDCPFCGEEIGWSKKPQIGELVICPACKGLSEVVSLKPVELDEPRQPKNRPGGSVRDKRRRSRKNRYPVYDLKIE